MTIVTPWQWCSHHHRPEHLTSPIRTSCKRTGWYRTADGARADVIHRDGEEEPASDPSAVGEQHGVCAACKRSFTLREMVDHLVDAHGLDANRMRIELGGPQG